LTPCKKNSQLRELAVLNNTDPLFPKVPPFMPSSKNWEIIRFADVLLFKEYKQNTGW